MAAWANAEARMFVVIFQVRPKADRWDAYLGYAALLRPEIVKIDGFIDNVRYASKRRPGLILSLSTWRDEKSLIRWRTHALHTEVQGKGRDEVFEDYHLCVGEVTADSAPPPGHAVREQRLDETEEGAAKAVALIETAGMAADFPSRAGEPGLVDHDVFEAILTPGAYLVMLSWRDAAAAARCVSPAGARHRTVRVVRDYGMFRRGEAPRYYPDIPKPLS